MTNKRLLTGNHHTFIVQTLAIGRRKRVWWATLAGTPIFHTTNPFTFLHFVPPSHQL